MHEWDSCFNQGEDLGNANKITSMIVIYDTTAMREVVGSIRDSVCLTQGETNRTGRRDE